MVVVVEWVPKCGTRGVPRSVVIVNRLGAKKANSNDGQKTIAAFASFMLS